MPKRRFLRDVRVAYNGILGVTTEKGQQTPYPLPLDAPTESYHIMEIRYETGALSTDQIGVPVVPGQFGYPPTTPPIPYPPSGLAYLTNDAGNILTNDEGSWLLVLEV